MKVRCNRFSEASMKHTARCGPRGLGSNCDGDAFILARTSNRGNTLIALAKSANTINVRQAVGEVHAGIDTRPHGTPKHGSWDVRVYGHSRS